MYLVPKKRNVLNEMQCILYYINISYIYLNRLINRVHFVYAKLHK